MLDLEFEDFSNNKIDINKAQQFFKDKRNIGRCGMLGRKQTTIIIPPRPRLNKTKRPHSANLITPRGFE